MADLLVAAPGRPASAGNHSGGAGRTPSLDRRPRRAGRGGGGGRWLAAAEIRRLRTQIKQIDPKRFVRIHRSAMVKIEAIKAVEPLFNGDRSLTLSRSYRDKAKAVLGEE